MPLLECWLRRQMVCRLKGTISNGERNERRGGRILGKQFGGGAGKANLLGLLS